MAKSKVTIEETYELPSEGKLYENVPAQVKLRAMTTLDEKLRLSSQDSMNIIPRLIKNCTVEPKDLAVDKLKLFDLHYLLYKLRTVTYGEDYKIELRCPYCGDTTEVTVNLDEIPVNKVPDDFVEPFEIGPLPINGDVIGCRILDSTDVEYIRRESKRILSKYPGYVGDPEMILKWSKRIVTINGEKVDQALIRKYIEELHARDNRFLESKYDKCTEDFGLDLSMIHSCDSCGRDIEFTLPITEEFFRPEY